MKVSAKVNERPVATSASPEDEDQDHGDAEEHGDGVALEVPALHSPLDGEPADAGDEADERHDAVDDDAVREVEEPADVAQRRDDGGLVDFVDPVLALEQSG